MQGGWQPPPGGGGGGGYGPPRPSAPPGSYVPNPYGGPTAPSPQYQQQGQQPPQPYPAGAAQYGSYEYNDYENSVIDRTAGRAKLWGYISTVVGVLQIFGSCGMFQNAMFGAYLPAGIVAIIVGVTFIGVGNSLKSIVQTRGNDMHHTMMAMQKLSSAFIVQIVCAIVAFVLAVGAILFVMLFVVAAAASR